MTWGAVAGAAFSVVGSAIAADGASDASGAQVAQSEAAIAEQRRQFDIAQANQRPFLQTGTAGNKRLAFLLGLSNNGTGTAAPDYEMVRNSLRQQFTTDRPWRVEEVGESSPRQVFIPAENTIDEAGLDRAAKAEFERQQQAFDAAQAEGKDPAYGSLLRRFSTADRDADPVYQSGLQFGLDEGRKGINQRAMQGGNYDSGQTLKALTRFGNDYGSTKANDSYNRFNADNTNIYNRLSGVSGSGQTAANSINESGANMANNVSKLQTGIGNSQAAGIVSGASAWGTGLQNLNSVYNNYQSRKLLNGVIGGGGYDTDGRDY
jgi:hypothetical protein